MRVIMLDIDGVIDSTRKRNHLDSARLARLVEVAKEAKCRVVISSHWRLIPTLHSHLKAVLRHLGVEVIGNTPTRRPWEPERPLEILEWLQAYNEQAAALERPHVTHFVAIDDRDLLSERGGDRLHGHFVRTDAETGLTESSAQQVTL